MKALAASVGFFVIFLVSAGAAAAQESYEEQMWVIADQIACPVCEGQSIKDSNADLARQMRELITEKLRAGDDADSIRGFFADRYGEGVLMDPPKQGFGLGIWIGPLIFFVVGVALVTTVLRRRPDRPGPSTGSVRVVDGEGAGGEEVARRGGAE